MHTPRWLAVSYSFILILGLLIALPNFLDTSTIKKMRQYVPFFPDKQITLGLDLYGGSSLQLEIDAEAIKREKLINLLDKVRSCLRTEQISQQSVHVVGEAVVVMISDHVLRQRAINAFSSLVSSVPGALFSVPVDDLAIQKNENGNIRITLTDNAINYYISNAIDQSLEIIRQRVDRIGVAEPSIQKVGKTRIQVQLPGFQNPAQLRTLLGTMAKMTFHLVRPNVDINNPPVGVSILPSYKEDSTERYAIEDKVSLDGSTLIDARSAYEHDTNRPMISFQLNRQGAKEFARISRENIGQALAIVLDNKVLTAPIIQSVIPNGRGQITGQFTSNDTATLSALLRAGSLPTPLKIVEERSIGPNLGARSIKMGLYTGTIGFILVAIFIFMAYGVWGIIADIALALHTVLVFSALSLLDATLTLPGIAGIILGIGIAVDANILVNECIREESRKGVSALAALDYGFRHAFSTILDANATIVIATFLLWYFGTGPVRGFAITMLIGVIISMFTDITVVRVIMIWLVRKWKIKMLNVRPILTFFPQYTNFFFMNARFIGIVISIILSIVSVFLVSKSGLNYGLDFKGGIQLEVLTKKNDLDALRSTLRKMQLGDVSLQSIGGNDGTLMIRVQHQQEGQEEAIDRIKEAIQTFDPNARFQRTEVIGPKISGELVRSSIHAVILSSIFVTLYIWLRFKWFFALSTIITLALDTTKMIGVFALFQFDFNLTAITALMMIIGYSINDKVVVYDRMRENLRLYRKMPLRDIIDMSINQVLVRCLFTSMTTVLAMLPTALFGESTIHNFALPVIIGVIITASSSIFIAAPVLLFLGEQAMGAKS